jgi:hypothetical protein
MLRLRGVGLVANATAFSAMESLPVLIRAISSSAYSRVQTPLMPGASFDPALSLARHLEGIPVRFEHSLHGERNSCIPAR